MRDVIYGRPINEVFYDIFFRKLKGPTRIFIRNKSRFDSAGHSGIQLCHRVEQQGACNDKLYLKIR